jgi:hypothetical protein
MIYLNDNIAVVTLFTSQFVALCGIFAGVFISWNNSRRIAHVVDHAATKEDLHEVHELVNGKTEQLEKLIKEKAFKAGVAEGEKK